MDELQVPIALFGKRPPNIVSCTANILNVDQVCTPFATTTSNNKLIGKNPVPQFRAKLTEMPLRQTLVSYSWFLFSCQERVG